MLVLIEKIALLAETNIFNIEVHLHLKNSNGAQFMKKLCFCPPTWNSHLESSSVFILFSRELHMRHMHIKLYFRINPIPRLEIDRAVTNGSAY